MRLSRDEVARAFVQRIEELSEERVLTCYQCGKCSAGCPMVEFMDRPPHQVIRLVQLGQEQAALAAEAPWYCAACHSCASRCPRGTDLSRVMEALRSVALRAGRPRLDWNKLPPEVLARLPQQAFVSGARKLT
ncbi:MAG: 4Fe-4S dicluster domain-containing protein [Bacillota bacterium]